MQSFSIRSDPGCRLVVSFGVISCQGYTRSTPSPHMLRCPDNLPRHFLQASNVITAGYFLYLPNNATVRWSSAPSSSTEEAQPGVYLDGVRRASWSTPFTGALALPRVCVCVCGIGGWMLDTSTVG